MNESERKVRELSDAAGDALHLLVRLRDVLTSVGASVGCASIELVDLARAAEKRVTKAREAIKQKQAEAHVPASDRPELCAACRGRLAGTSFENCAYMASCVVRRHYYDLGARSAEKRAEGHVLHGRADARIVSDRAGI